MCVLKIYSFRSVSCLAFFRHDEIRHCIPVTRLLVLLLLLCFFLYSFLLLYKLECMCGEYTTSNLFFLFDLTFWWGCSVDPGSCVARVLRLNTCQHVSWHRFFAKIDNEKRRRRRRRSKGAGSKRGKSNGKGETERSLEHSIAMPIFFFLIGFLSRPVSSWPSFLPVTVHAGTLFILSPTIATLLGTDLTAHY